MSSWHGKECDLLDLEGVFLVKGHVTASNPRKAIMDDILGQDHVDLTIYYYTRNISMVMTIWKWSLAYTIVEGFLLKRILKLHT